MLETLFRHLEMVRLSIATAVMISWIGCTGLLDGGSDGLTPQERDAQARWKADALPVLRDNCSSCHAGARPAIDFLTGTQDLEIRARIKAYDPPVVNFEAPGSSRVLSKGIHEGPALTAAQSATLLQWLQSEQDSATHDPDNPIQLLATPAFAVQICTAGLPDEPTCPTNHVSLMTVGDAGASIPGAEISFTAQALSSGLYVTNLKISGGTAGAYIEHPLFVSRPADTAPVPDQIDRYFDLKMNVKASVADQMAGGTAQFIGFAATDMLEIHFKVVSAFKPEAGPAPQGGCKALAQFKANAAGPLQAACASCHAGNANANARSTMDITGANSAVDATALLACNQVRTRTNLTSTDASAIYLAPDPGSQTNHPFKFAAAAFTTYKNSVDIWVQAEKTAPQGAP